MYRRSLGVVAPLLALAITTATLTAAAQTKSKTSSKSATTKKTATSKYHRLPTYYGQLKLKDEQVKEIYSIKDSYGKKIDDLVAELAKLKKEQSEDVKDVLTRTQVTALNKLIAGTSTAKKNSTAKKSGSSKKK